ncbi:unnamed protein product [Chrysodeixis includens]|uniref:Carboxylesterase type B domain-containing protein n=1 Tax=Chrysodeixis includens TaxID=689277 RepID=A0A9N8L5J3_CHRIL|nr:unnamed protein product [Chrysodeixis includens]
MLPRACVLLALCAAVCVHAHKHKHQHTTEPTKVSSTPAPAESAPVVRSVSGVFRGSWMASRRGRRFQAYRGIRYAEPPVGELRFQPPKLKLQYSGEVDASQEGPACPLPVPPTYYIDEDCLTVNVYTPTTNSKTSGPCLFHRAISMSASPINKGPMVTHQRHLAVLQAQILKCPTDNTSVIYDCLMKKPWREIGDSLPQFWSFGPGDPVGLWGPVAEPDFGQERYLSEDPLAAIQHGRLHTVPYIISQTTDEFFWKAFPVLQNATLLKTMNEEWERIAPVSFLLPPENRSAAVARLREVYLQNKPLANDAQSEKALGRLYGDSVIGFGVHRLANLMCRHSKHPVWYYEFAYIGNNSHYQDPNGKPRGAAHHDDLLYLFTLSYMFPTIPLSSKDSHVVDEMTAMWYNFARYGDPNPRGDTPELSALAWPAMTPRQRNYLRRGDQLTVHQNMFEDRFKVWDELYPIDY